MDPITPPSPQSHPPSPTSHLHLWQYAAGVLAALLLALLIIGWHYGATPAPELSPPDSYAGWLRYDSPQGFTFRYPAGYSVNAVTDPEDEQRGRTIVHLVANDTRDSAPPVMQLAVDPNVSVTFAVWEGAQWEPFDDVVTSFEFSYEPVPPSP